MKLFLVATVAAGLGIRAYLTATECPHVSGGNFHIAHVLPGGVLMAASSPAP